LAENPPEKDVDPRQEKGGVRLDFPITAETTKDLPMADRKTAGLRASELPVKGGGCDRF
jgi:hypothetical protein